MFLIFFDVFLFQNDYLYSFHKNIFTSVSDLYTTICFCRALAEIFPNMQELLKNSLWVQITNHFKTKLRSKMKFFMDFWCIFVQNYVFLWFFDIFSVFPSSKTNFYIRFIKIYLPLSLIYTKLYVFAKLSPRSFQICKNCWKIRYGCR